jgi:hypothetical protein
MITGQTGSVANRKKKFLRTPRAAKWARPGRYDDRAFIYSDGMRLVLVPERCRAEIFRKSLYAWACCHFEPIVYAMYQPGLLQGCGIGSTLLTLASYCALLCGHSTMTEGSKSIWAVSRHIWPIICPLAI